MTDQNSQFFAMLTAVGEAKQANADALGIAWKITHMGVGDANGTEPTPDRLQTALLNERRRAPLNQLKVDPGNASIIIAEQIIPEDVGGWWIREIGLYDESGALVAIANCPPSFKPQLAQGSGRIQVVRMNLIVSSATNVELKIDPSVVLASRAWVTDSFLKVEHRVADIKADSPKRLRFSSLITGDEELTGAATRDSIVVGRTLEGLTDCHAFADRTIIKSVSDSGTYGVFDATTRLEGAHTHNHVYAYQDRVNYAGSGTLQNMAGLYSAPVFSGPGVIAQRAGVEVRDVSITGGGTLQSNIGLLIKDLINGSARVGVNIGQTTGHALYAPGGARSYLRGDLGVGIDNTTGAHVALSGGAGTVTMFLDTTAALGAVGVFGDYPLSLVVNGLGRAEINNAAGLYSLRPGTDNTQPIGEAPRRWSTVYAGTGSINTSDARVKGPLRPLNEAEIDAARQLAKEIGAFRFLDALAEKGAAAREHIGMTVQRAIEIMQDNGLDPFGYGFVCYDAWAQETREHPAEYEPSILVDIQGQPLPGKLTKAAWTEVVTEAGDRFSFRYDELLAFIGRGFEARLTALEAVAGIGNNA